MKRRLVWIAPVAFGLLACRGIVGIEALELVDRGADAGRDASLDAASDAASRADADADGGARVVCSSAQDCRMCCRDNYGPELKALQDLGKSTHCLCADDAGCLGACATTMCATGAASASPPPPACGQCVDDRIISPACAQAATQCRAMPDCAPGLECYQSCP